MTNCLKHRLGDALRSGGVRMQAVGPEELPLPLRERVQILDTTIGTWCFHAFSFPQKQTESVYTTSGRKERNSSSRKASMPSVIRISEMVISVVDTFFSPEASFSVRAGR